MNRLSQVSQQLTSPNLMPSLRKQSTLQCQDFKQTIWGPNWHWRERGIKYILQNIDKHPYYHVNEASREEQRRETANLMRFYAGNRDVTNEEYDRDHNVLTSWSNPLYGYSPGFCVKNAVHIVLYMKTLIMLGTDKHQALIGRAYDHKDIGCFALTQALHGTNVKGLLTEAHYDHANRQFIIHSPSRDAMKFWIGAAANLATMTVCWAQLYIDGVCYGVHVFVVPLRDPSTHDLLPGVLIGDCGPKNGLNEIDNGFILFNKVRVPVTNLLNRLSGVDANGKFYNTCKNEDARFGLQLGAISGGRIAIAGTAPTMALNALSIAIRYTCIRKQFAPPGSPQQLFLFEYPLTRFRLIPLLAQAVVYQQVGSKMNLKWDRSYKKLLDPNNPDVQQQHSISSVMKAQSSWFASEALVECRQILGGHGYSSFSRLGSMYHENDINKTWEGDNSVLLQQSLKFVLEAAQNMTKNKPIEVEMLKFLSEPPAIDEDIKVEQLRDLEFLQQVFEARVSDKLQETGMRLFDLKTKKYELFDIWNHSQVNYGQTLAMYYGDLVYLLHAKKAIPAFRSPTNRNIYRDCIILWALRTLRKDAYGTQQTQNLIRGLMEQYVEILAKEALAILEVLAAPSRILNSPFADEEGRGFAMYLNMIYAGKETFRKVEWFKVLTERDRS